MKIDQKIPNSVNWPVMIKHDMDAEIAYVESQSDWDSDFSEAIYAEEDFLIDSEGMCFQIITKRGRAAKLQLINRSISNKELTNWVREYAAQQRQCCIAKLYIHTIQDALDFVKALDS